MMFNPIDMNVTLVPCTGSAEIQAQHLMLFESWTRIATIFNEREGKVSADECVNLLYVLRGYVVDHFCSEEQWQSQHNWPMAAEHKLVHDKFIKTVNDLPQVLWVGSFKPACTEAVIIQIRDWLVCHTSQADAEFYAWMEGHNND